MIVVGWFVSVVILEGSDLRNIIFFLLGYSSSYMLKVWTLCWSKFCVASAYSDDHLLSNCLSYWKGK